MGPLHHPLIYFPINQSTSSTEKSTDTYMTASDSGDSERSNEVMKKKMKQILRLSDEEDKEEESKEKDTINNQEDNSKLNELKYKVQNFDETGLENYRSRFSPLLYWKKAGNAV